jgi:hypothetical protein
MKKIARENFEINIDNFYWIIQIQKPIGK